MTVEVWTFEHKFGEGEPEEPTSKMEVDFVCMGTFPICGTCKHYLPYHHYFVYDDGGEVPIHLCGIYKTEKDENDTCKRWKWDDKTQCFATEGTVAKRTGE